VHALAWATPQQQAGQQAGQHAFAAAPAPLLPHHAQQQRGGSEEARALRAVCCALCAVHALLCTRCADAPPYPFPFFAFSQEGLARELSALARAQDALAADVAALAGAVAHRLTQQQQQQQQQPSARAPPFDDSSSSSLLRWARLAAAAATGALLAVSVAAHLRRVEALTEALRRVSAERSGA
jgi:hypothetical protein